MSEVLPTKRNSTNRPNDLYKKEGVVREDEVGRGLGAAPGRVASSRI